MHWSNVITQVKIIWHELCQDWKNQLNWVFHPGHLRSIWYLAEIAILALHLLPSQIVIFPDCWGRENSKSSLLQLWTVCWSKHRNIKRENICFGPLRKFFAWPKRGRPTSGFSIFIRSEWGTYRATFVSFDQILVPTHSLRDKRTKGKREKG